MIFGSFFDKKDEESSFTSAKSIVKWNKIEKKEEKKMIAICRKNYGEWLLGYSCSIEKRKEKKIVEVFILKNNYEGKNKKKLKKKKEKF